MLPGHALLGAQFTATSMIGMIALGGALLISTAGAWLFGRAMARPVQALIDDAHALAVGVAGHLMSDTSRDAYVQEVADEHERHALRRVVPCVLWAQRVVGRAARRAAFGRWAELTWRPPTGRAFQRLKRGFDKLTPPR